MAVPAPAAVKHYSLKDRSVVLSPSVEAAIAQVANLYNAATGKNIVLTDGIRDAAMQADRIYTKLVLGDNVYKLYGNRAALDQVVKAYNDASQAGLSAKDISKAMADVIAQQMANGIFISRHLRGQAVDVRKSDMTASQQAAFQKAVEDQGSFKLVDEGIPPHFHLQPKPQ